MLPIELMISIISLSIAFLGLFISIFSLVHNIRSNSSNLMKNDIMLIYNEELWNTYLMFENRDELNTNWYNQSFYDTNSIYNKNGCIDKLFGHFNFVCYLMKTKQILKEEISLYKYYIKQTLRDYNSLLYLYNLFYYVIYLDFNDNNRVEFLDFLSIIDRHPYKY